MKDAWYIAAWPEELDSKALFTRTVLGEALVLFRNQKETISALQDRCPHRFAPLHAGTLHDGLLQCGYHGLTFDGGGNCVRAPLSPAPNAARVRSYPIVEKDGIVWIWMGDAEKADTTSVPVYAVMEESTPFSRTQGYIHIKGNYELMSDNIMDLSHVDFLHATSLGSGVMSTVKPAINQVGNCVSARWETFSSNPAPIYKKFIPETDALVDQVVEVKWHPPCHMELTSSVTSGTASRTKLLLSQAIHVMTPETETSTHYFYASTRNYGATDAETNARRTQAVRAAFEEEDKPMIEKIQISMGDMVDVLRSDAVLLPSDAGAVRARRILQRLIAEENSEFTP